MIVTRVVLVIAMLGGSASAGAAHQALVLAETTDGRSYGDGGARRAMTAVKVSGAAPVVDGALDEASWAGAAIARDFMQREPSEGAPASERTEVRILYDDEALYIGARLYDAEPDSIMASVTRRDADATSDEFWVQLDSYFDRRTAFIFKVTPSGARADGMIVGGNWEDMGWDAVWAAAASRDSLGWIAEIAIPLTQLRFAPATEADGAAGLTWGLNLTRRIARRNEWSQWSLVPRDAPQVVSYYGELQDLQLATAPRRLEVLPYTVSSVTRAPVAVGDPFARRNDFSTSVGADIKYGLTSNLTLNATINPDFGQVEADPSQVNLGVSELFLPEKRPFFLEGMDLFESGFPQLFYSRRIGRAPQGGVPDAAAYADVPGTTRILGAAKLSGKMASGWSVGVLSALTGSATAEYVDAAGTPGAAIVEPTTNYLMARVGREMRDGGTRLGATVTAVNRRLGGTNLDFLRDNAVAGGLDWQHRFLNGAFLVRGTLQASRIAGDTAAIGAAQRSSVRYMQRPDATHLEYDPTRTSLTGYSAFSEIVKDRGKLRTGIGSAMRSPGFEINDLGFQFDADIRTAFGWIGYADFEPNSLFRYSRATLNLWNAWNFGGDRLASELNLNGSVQLLNYWEVEGMVSRDLGGLDTRALRGGPMLRDLGGTMSWVQLESNPNAAFSGGVEVSGWKDAERGSNTYVSPFVSYRPSARAELNLGPAFSWNDDHSQFVTTSGDAPAPDYIVGRVQQRTVSLTARASYAFTPALSFQFYAQPFISAGAYDAFRAVDAPRAETFDARFRPVADGEFDIGNPDFNVKELNTNAVVRWEYRPGSTLFLVWAHGRGGSSADGTFDLRRDASRLLDLPGSNTLLVKASYWFNP